jgi:hypothetical protein
LLVKEKINLKFPKNSCKVKPPSFRIAKEANNMKANSHFHLFHHATRKGKRVWGFIPKPFTFTQKPIFTT